MTSTWRSRSLLSPNVRIAIFSIFFCFCLTSKVVTVADSTYIHEDGYCMWYDQCGTDSLTHKSLNCLYNKPAKVLNDTEGLEILEQLCPQLVAPNGTETRTCCSTSQLRTFRDNMKIPDETMSRCPSCYTNLVNMYCYLTCSSNQSKWVNATKTTPYPPPTFPPPLSDNEVQPGNKSQLSITEVDYYIVNETAQAIYDSCKNVNFPSSNTKVLSLYCGSYGAAHCTAQRWLDFMGDKDNQQTPFQINFHLGGTPESMDPMDTRVFACNESTSDKTQPCSCQDCPPSCPPLPPLPPPPPPFTIAGIDGYVFIFSVLYGVFVILFLLLNFLCMALSKKGENLSECCDENSTAVNSVNEDEQQEISEDEVNCKASCGMAFQRLIELGFRILGTFVAGHPFIVLVVGIMVVTGMSAGFVRLQITTDPVELWSPPTSESRLEKNYFDEHFGPFYRTEQIIITAPHSKPYNVTREYPFHTVTEYSGILEIGLLHQLLDLQTEIMTMRAPFNDSFVTLEDICYAPLAPENPACVVESVLNYFQNSHDMLNKVAYDPSGWLIQADYHEHLLSCAGAPASLNDTTALHTPCMGTYGGPVFPWTAMGGYEGDEYNKANVLIITFPVVNYIAGDPRLEKAMAWESAYIDMLKNYSNTNFTIAFQSERSVEDEINRESRSDVFTIALSYIFMFAYVTFALGQVNSCTRLLIDSKIILGLSGVIIVLMSVASSIGVLSWAGVPATLIVIEVVPFLVLAVGVDNIFLLVQRYQRDQRYPHESRAEHIGRILGEVAPSMLLTSSSESIAFGLGAMSSMPAVRAFSMYAAVAVAMDFLLQITCFVAMMSLDSARQEANRYEILCCSSNKNAGKQPKEPGILYRVVKDYYTPFLFTRIMRILVVLFFTFMLFASCAMVPSLSVGLDQKLSMPEDSYMVHYFEAEGSLLQVGPPVYFVVKDGFNYTSIEGQNKICGGTGCNDNSLTSQIYLAAQTAEYTRIAHPSSSWMDDFFDWVKPSGELTCCRTNDKTGDFCPSTDLLDNCTSCRPMSEKNSRPTTEEFEEFLPFFLEDVPGVSCSKGGKAAYGAALNFTDTKKTEIRSSYFMTYHTTMRNSSTYIAALKMAREVAANITAMMNVTDNPEFNVFPYSIFYVYYEQYLTIVHETFVSLGIVIGAVFGVTFILMAFDLSGAIISTLTIAMITIDIMGMMYLWEIQLNAVSLVNLIMSVGISVEFCSHIVKAFTLSTKRTRLERAEDALAHVGSSVLSGITLTKAFGIIILAFSHSQLFKVYYFRMYLGMVLFGGSHGLIFLPVFLSYIGPGVNKAHIFDEQERYAGRSRRGADNEHLIPSADSQGNHYA